MTLTVIGHRGVALHYPENTRSSILAAIDLGLKWIEVDIQPTRDGVLVVCHDHTLDRCSNGSGRLDECTLDQLKKLDFGGWFDSQFVGEKLMTLEELLTLIEPHDLSVNLEVKVDRHDVANVVALLKTTLESATAPLGTFPSDRIHFSSFNHHVMRLLHRELPSFKRSVLSERFSPRLLPLLAEVEATGCNLNIELTSKKTVDTLHQHGYQVWCYTVNNPNKLRHLKNLNGVFSDAPERFL
ncbi:glycerophosphodiester phosphodiesterase family protein [Vibrio mexicanus]|uniref:glycerophosphodiester phosphodiesterase family protein n=1 Tax=Vibrio mexicanus TaxID=1004326 RepID=UPI00063C34E0|nr:glycerophosphodiester phosphodiesterase family protein [Vibrio mexicanus]